LGAAEATDLLGSPSEIVVDGEFLTRLDHAKAYVQNVTLHHTADQVGLATVIDDFSAAPIDGAIDAPVIVKHKQVRVVRMLCLSPVEPFARIFDHFTVGRNQFARVDAVAMNFGLPDRELEDCVRLFAPVCQNSERMMAMTSVSAYGAALLLLLMFASASIAPTIENCMRVGEQEPGQ
jgi:hypothetical protein